MARRFKILGILFTLLLISAAAAGVVHHYGWDCIKAGGELFQDHIQGVCRDLPPELDLDY